MKTRTSKEERHENRGHVSGSKSIKNMKKKKKNMKRLGGQTLSLEAFANSKSMRKSYNPAFIKKKREFYKNAKFVRKYKKTLKQETQQNDVSSAIRPLEEENTIVAGKMSKWDKKNKKNKSHSLRELFEKKREEDEKARIERQAIIEKKKEERERAAARRKVMKEKMSKKTWSGQPVMKYRIEHLLETIQGSKS